jgi:preprotein translocase subunit SecA
VRQAARLQARVSQRTAAELSQQAAELARRARDPVARESLVSEALAAVTGAMGAALGRPPTDAESMAALIAREGGIAHTGPGHASRQRALLAAACLAAILDGRVHLAFLDEPAAAEHLEQAGDTFRLLGLDARLVREAAPAQERSDAYRGDVTLGSYLQFGLDYLRDGLAMDAGDQMQCPASVALLDEADVVLVDNAGVPLVIRRMAAIDSERARQIDRLAGGMRRGTDYAAHEQPRVVALTPGGLTKVTSWAAGNGYPPSEGMAVIGAVERQIAAGEWPASDGAATAEQVMARITVRDYFRLYARTAGVATSAASAAREILHFYGAGVSRTSPDQAQSPGMQADELFRRGADKFHSLADEVANRIRLGFSIVIGAQSQAVADQLQATLDSRDITYRIVAGAGVSAAAPAESSPASHVTILTAQAAAGYPAVGNHGAGTFVVGAERGLSPRWDDRLTAVAADLHAPGECKFFMSLEDPLWRRAGPELETSLRKPVTLGRSPLGRVLSSTVRDLQQSAEDDHFARQLAIYSFKSVNEAQRRRAREWRQSVLTAGSVREILARATAIVADTASLAGPPGDVNPQHDGAGSGRTASADALRSTALLAMDNAWTEHLADLDHLYNQVGWSGEGRDDLPAWYGRMADERFAAMADRVYRAIVLAGRT